MYKNLYVTGYNLYILYCNKIQAKYYVSEITKRRRCRQAEENLDMATKMFNRAKARNNALRGDIDNLRRAIHVLSKLYDRIEAETEAKKKETLADLDEANKAYEQREALVEKIAGENFRPRHLEPFYTINRL